MASDKVAIVWNLRNNITPLSEDIRARIRQIRQDAPEIANFRRGKPASNWKGGSGWNGGRPSQQQQQQQQQQPLPSAQPYQKYQSRFKKAEQPVEDKILHNVILSKLNKFSSETFKEIELFLCQILDSGETDFIKEFMLLVFKKAASEEVFCPLYAKLISNLRHKYPQLLSEMRVLYKSYLQIFEEIVESDAVSKEEVIKLNTEKAYRRGYSQFLAELAGLEVLDKENIVEVFTKLVGLIKSTILLDDKKALADEYCDCLLRISRVIKKSIYYKETKDNLRMQCALDLESFTKINPAFKSLSSRTRFQCMEIFENISK